MAQRGFLNHCLGLNFFVYTRCLFSKDLFISPLIRAQSQFAGTAILNLSCAVLHVPNTCQLKCHWFLRHISTGTLPTISWQGSSRLILLNKIEHALKDHQADEALEVFKDYKSLYGLPDQEIVSKLIIELCYSSKSGWLQKAYDLTLVILKEKFNLLRLDLLCRLALALARAQMPIPASRIMRIMLEKEKFPSIDVLSAVFLHLVKSQIGAYIASNLLIEIWERHLHHIEKRCSQISKRSKLLILNTTIFNIVLDACVQFDATLKAHQIMEVMPRAEVVADAHSIIIMSIVYERNGQRDELRKLKDHIDGVLLDRHYQHFYDCLLSLHFKFNDMDAAAGILLELYGRHDSLNCASPLLRKDADLGKMFSVPMGSCNLKDGARMQIMPQLLQKDFIFACQYRPRLIAFENGKLVTTNRALAKLINGYVGERRVRELSNFFSSMNRLGFFSEACKMSSDVIMACTQLGWLETAHDILDDMEAAAIPVGTGTYYALLRAYCKENKTREARVLIKQMRKDGMLDDLSDDWIMTSSVLDGSSSHSFGPKASTPSQMCNLAKSLLNEIEEEPSTSPLVYNINSSIFFFCKAKMMEDALKTFRKMQRMKLQPTVQTFSHLVNGFSSLQMYREIATLWGVIKGSLDEGLLNANRDLFECLLLNFIRCGYFERALEVIGYMTKEGHYADKWEYKREFSKFHKYLYRSLKASKVRSEAQSKRLAHVVAFRRFVGIDR